MYVYLSLSIYIYLYDDDDDDDDDDVYLWKRVSYNLFCLHVLRKTHKPSQ
jgi:hypothetical protein